MRKQPSSKVISFRIERKLAARLHKKAIAQRLSLNSYIKDLFLEALIQQELRDDLLELHDEVREIGVEVSDLRRDLARVLSKLLTELADWDEGEAEDWILYRFSGQLPSDYEGGKDLS